jgi:hypothetical protein
MKYLCLVYGEERALQDCPDEHCVAFDASIRQSGQCLASEALQPISTATTVRVRNGKVSVTDGPFAETKEQLAGFYMIESSRSPSSNRSGSCDRKRAAATRSMST